MKHLLIITILPTLCFGAVSFDTESDLETIAKESKQTNIQLAKVNKALDKMNKILEKMCKMMQPVAYDMHGNVIEEEEAFNE